MFGLIPSSFLLRAGWYQGFARRPSFTESHYKAVSPPECGENRFQHSEPLATRQPLHWCLGVLQRTFVPTRADFPVTEPKAVVFFHSCTGIACGGCLHM